MNMRTLIFVPFVCAASYFCQSHATVLSTTDQQEVRQRWGSIFVRQLDAIEQDLNFVANQQERDDILWLLRRAAVLADRMLNFTEDDEYTAFMLMAQHEEGSQWQRFLVAKDAPSIQEYLEHAAYSLCGYVHEHCVLRFPLQLCDLDEQIEITGLDEQVFITRARQAFLAFTFLVSKMGAIVRNTDAV